MTSDDIMFENWEGLEIGKQIPKSIHPHKGKKITHPTGDCDLEKDNQLSQARQDSHLQILEVVCIYKSLLQYTLYGNWTVTMIEATSCEP